MRENFTNRSRTRTNNAFNSSLRGSRIHFQRRGLVSDGFGGMVPGGPPVTQFTSDANMRPLGLGANGTEAFTNSVLAGNQPFLVTVRNRPELKNVTVAWRLQDARNALRFFNIKSQPVDPDGTNRFREFVVIENQPS